jgi:protein-tyrosine-phosphatase
MALFVCRRNAGRSQMSQALFERAARGRHTAQSAGTAPAEHVHPTVVEVMLEVGIDLSGVTPRELSRAMVERADVVVTMGCGDQCPVVPGTRRIEWSLPDPEDSPLADVRTTRDTIAKQVEALVTELDGVDGWAL